MYKKFLKCVKFTISVHRRSSNCKQGHFKKFRDLLILSLPNLIKNRIRNLLSIMFVYIFVLQQKLSTKRQLLILQLKLFLLYSKELQLDNQNLKKYFVSRQRYRKKKSQIDSDERIHKYFKNETIVYRYIKQMKNPFKELLVDKFKCNL